MNSRVWTNVFLSIVVILLSIIILLDKDNLEKELPSLSDIDPDNISKIEIQRENLETLSFSNNNGEWQIDSPLKFQANYNRIRSILNILKTKSYKKFNLDEVDIEKFELESPKVILKLDENKFLFGTTNPIDQKRYIIFDKTIHLIDDYLFPQLMVNVFFFAEAKLLPKGINIISIDFPNNKLEKRNDSWVSSIDKYNEEKIISIVNKWQSATAVTVSEYKKEDDKEIISIQSLSGEKINFTIVATEPRLILGRNDKGIQYELKNDDAIQMF